MNAEHLSPASPPQKRHWISRLVDLLAVIVECFLVALRPRSWVRPVRARFLRQVLFGGVEAVPFTVFAGIMTGLVLTLTSYKWLTFTGRIEFLGDALSVLVIREAAPFLSCVIVVSASASAITAELATMRVTGQIDLIEAQGINVFESMIMPRVIGLTCATFALSVTFMAAAFASVGLSVAFIQSIPLGPFLLSIFESVTMVDFYNLLGRSAIAAFLIGAVSCYEGMMASGPLTVVPQAVTRAMVQSVGVILLVSAGFALATSL